MLSRIPSSFRLFGEKISVVFSEEYFTSEHLEATGFASYRSNKIILKPSTKSYPLNDDQIEQTFLHELMHFILYYAGDAYEPKEGLYMHQNEGFVNMCASLLHQAMTTAEFSNET